MKIYKEESLWNFDFWSGARDNASELDRNQMEQIESVLEDVYPDGMDATDLNDLFWFEFDTVLSWIGLKQLDDGRIVDEDYEEDEYEDEDEEEYEDEE